MPNIITAIEPQLYNALRVVSRELTGMIPSVTIDGTTSRAAVGQVVKSFVAPAAQSYNITPGQLPADNGDQTIGSVEMTIQKSKAVPIRWSGEEELMLSAGHTASLVRIDQIAQAFRTLANEVEADGTALYSSMSRAFGTPGTTPFGTANDYTAASFTRKILVDNGAPQGDLQLIVDTAAGANIRGKQANASDQGSTSILRQGVLLDTNGMAIRESAQIKTHTAGSFSSGTLTSAVRAKGTTVLATTADYSGGLGAGDIITLAHESNAHMYVIASVSASAITINEPGLVNATAATGTVAITKVATSVRNLAFSRSAIMLATRAPATPQEGDLAIARSMVTDPASGLSFEISVYPEYRRVRWEVALAWGWKVVTPAHTALLLG